MILGDAVVKKQKIKRHIPQRTCVGCRKVQEKRTLIRIVRSSTEGVKLDVQGKLSGRGAYLHDSPECWEKGLKGPLANALKTSLTEEELERLIQYKKTLTVD